MQCPHCGTSVQGAPSTCEACGADLSRSVIIDPRSWLQRFRDSPTAPRALLAVIPCALGAWEMISSLYRNANLALMVQATGAAAMGGFLAASVLLRKRYVFERMWPRFLAW